MADKKTNPEIIAEPVAPEPASSFTISNERAAALAELWQCTPEQAIEREAARLAKKRGKAAA